MCIICKIKQAGISEEALEMVELLAEFAVIASNGLARLKAEGALLNAEEEFGLIPARAITNGAKLQVVNLSDIMPDESITKH